MDIVEYLSKSINMYFGKVNEGYNYIKKNVGLWDAIIVYYFIILISMILTSLTNVDTYKLFGNNAMYLVIAMFIGSLIVLPIGIFIGYGLVHLFLKMFGGQATFQETVKFAISASIFSGIIGTLTSILSSLIINSTGEIVASMILSIVMMFISLGVAIWGLVILVLVLAKAHKITEMKAFFAIILPVVILLIIVFMIALFVGLALYAMG